MKKLIALVLTLALAFTLAGCSVLGGLGKEKSRSKTYQLYQDYFMDGSYFMELSDTSNDIPVAMAIDGNNLYVKTVSDGQNIVMIQNADGSYMLMPDEMLYYDLGGQDLTGSFPDYSTGAPTEDNEATMETGDMDFDGGNYFYESFAASSTSSIRYLYDGDTLAYTIIYNGEEPETIQKFYSVEADVDPSLFTIPDGYSPLA